MTPADRSYRWLFWTLAFVGLAADLGSKYGVFAWLYSSEPRYVLPSGQLVCEAPFEVVPGVFDLVARYSVHPWEGDGLLQSLRTLSAPNRPFLNHGALFGIGGDTTFGNYLFTGVSLIAALAITIWSTRPAAARDRYLCIALGMILAGTLGNFYDRVVFGGVRDFLHWYKWYDWPVFNIADCCLVCGASLLVLEAFLRTPVAETKPVESSASTPS